MIPRIFQTLLPDFAAGGVAYIGGTSAPPYGGAGGVGGTPGALPIIVGVSACVAVPTGAWYGGAGVAGGVGRGAGAARIVASVEDGGGAGGCMPRSVIFGSTIVSLPVGRGGSFTGGAAIGGGGMLCSMRAPQFPQKRSSALTSL